MPRAAALGLGSAATPVKRSEIVRDAEQSQRAAALRAIGLPEIDPRHRDRAGYGFERLGNIGVYVVTAVDQTQAQVARALLEPEYHIMPNIALSLPASSLATRRLVRRPSGFAWPEVSGVAAARRAGLTGKGVLVGVLDTGVDADHAEFARKRIEFRYVPLDPAPDGMRAVRGFDVHGHGTHVCGIIGGRTVGVAPGAELMVAAVIESETVRTSLERIVIALDWMLSQFRLEEHRDKPMIVSMSLGFREDWISAPAFHTVTEGMRLLLATLVHDFDVLPVVAIGNDGPGQVRAPGYFTEALAVGAVDFEGGIWPYSGSGLSPDGVAKPDLMGYGVDVVSSLERDIGRRSIYAPMSGTSMAAPYVTGIAALLAEAHPGLQGEALRERLIRDALSLEAPPERAGAGLARYL
jgi:subtilisin family serine protease